MANTLGSRVSSALLWNMPRTTSTLRTMLTTGLRSATLPTQGMLVNRSAVPVTNPPTVHHPQVMQTRSFFRVDPPQRLKLRCDHCYFAIINNRKYILCRKCTKHNQVQKIPSAWLKYLETQQSKALKQY